MTTKLKLLGLKETLKALRDLPDEIERPAFEEALTEAGEPMRQLAADLAPRRRSENSLADNIVITPNGPGNPERRDEVRVYMGPDLQKPGAAPHGHLAEFGTGPRYHKSGKYVGQMPATPFIRPAFDAEARGTIKRVGPLLWAIVKRAADRVRARSVTP